MMKFLSPLSDIGAEEVNTNSFAIGKAMKRKKVIYKTTDAITTKVLPTILIALFIIKSRN